MLGPRIQRLLSLKPSNTILLGLLSFNPFISCIQLLHLIALSEKHQHPNVAIQDMSVLALNFLVKM